MFFTYLSHNLLILGSSLLGREIQLVKDLGVIESSHLILSAVLEIGIITIILLQTD